MSNFFHHLDLTLRDPKKSRPLYELCELFILGVRAEEEKVA